MSADEVMLVRGFWGPRAESVDDISHRLSALGAVLDGLVAANIPWRTADGVAVSLADANSVRTVLDSALERSLDAPEVGILEIFEARCLAAASWSMTVTAGGTSTARGVKNSVVLKLSSLNYLSAIVEKILEGVVAAWDPDWGDVTSDSILDGLSDRDLLMGRAPKFGHMTYLSSGRGPITHSGVELSIVTLPGGRIFRSPASRDHLFSAAEAVDLTARLTGTGPLAETPTTRSKL